LKKQTNQRLVTQKQELFDRWQDLEGLCEKYLDETAETSGSEVFLATLQKTMGQSKSDYIAVIRGLDEAASQQGTKWLQGIVDKITEEAFDILPSFCGA
jgi:rhamnogalacturonyl hydrolase YesR